jgi:hypothetical protein
MKPPLAAERHRLRLAAIMSCACSKLSDIVRLEEHPGIERDSDQLERDNWFWLVHCRSCGQLWSLDEWEKHQRQFAIKIPQREGWHDFDTTPLRQAFLIESRGGLTDEPCIWSGCSGWRVRGVVYCAEHLFKTGVRE